MPAMTVSAKLKAAIRRCPHSRYQIAKATGVTESALSRFISGRRSLSLAAVDKLAAHLGLTLASIPKQKNHTKEKQTP
jgi:transcriptional regulator with XRE-family HTH domain